MAYKDSAPHR